MANFIAGQLQFEHVYMYVYARPFQKAIKLSCVAKLLTLPRKQIVFLDSVQPQLEAVQLVGREEHSEQPY